MTSDLAQWNSGLPDATALAAAVRAGELSAGEVLARARAAHDPGHNIFVTADWDGAAGSAARIDERRSKGEELGALAGVPVTVKDVIAVAGLPATAASRALSAYRHRHRPRRPAPAGGGRGADRQDQLPRIRLRRHL